MDALNLDYDDMPGWCAGTKISGITNKNIRKINIEYLIKKVAQDFGTSVICVSVNETETDVIKWLKDNKFRKGPMMKNWGHNGRKTNMYFKQITKRDWLRYGGDANW